MVGRIGSVFSKLLVVCVLLGLAGCETGYFWSVESLGFKRQDLFINSTGNLRDELRASDALLKQFGVANVPKTDAKTWVSDLKSQVSKLKKQNRTFKRRGDIWLSTLERKGGFPTLEGFGVTELTSSVQQLQTSSNQAIAQVTELRKAAKKELKGDFSGFSAELSQSIDRSISQLQELEKSIHELSFTIESHARLSLTP